MSANRPHRTSDELPPMQDEFHVVPMTCAERWIWRAVILTIYLASGAVIGVPLVAWLRS